MNNNDDIYNASPAAVAERPRTERRVSPRQLMEDDYPENYMEEYSQLRGTGKLYPSNPADDYPPPRGTGEFYPEDPEDEDFQPRATRTNYPARRAVEYPPPFYESFDSIAEPARPGLKSLKVLAMFFAVFTLLYLSTNTLSDSVTEHDYSGAVAPTQAPETVNNNYDLTVPYMAGLVPLMEDYPRVRDIADKIWRFPSSLLELALRNNETIDFVAGYLQHGQNIAVFAEQLDVSDEMANGSIPHFVQWDTRWGYSYYGGEIMAIDGCGPTALAMVAAGLTGDSKYNPRYIADFSQDNRYITADNSTTWTLMSVGSKSFGLEPKELTLDAYVITGCLKRGEPIIASVGPGDFTQGGHFIVLTGVTSDGKILLNDPNSYLNTAKEWDVQRIMSQIKNLWSFKLQ